MVLIIGTFEKRANHTGIKANPRGNAAVTPAGVLSVLPITQTLNHKGLQRTANEYAEEHRIFKDLIKKNNKQTI